MPGLLFKLICGQPLSLETSVVIWTRGVSNSVVQIASRLVRRKQPVPQALLKPCNGGSRRSTNSTRRMVEAVYDQPCFHQLTFRALFYPDAVKFILPEVNSAWSKDLRGLDLLHTVRDR